MSDKIYIVLRNGKLYHGIKRKSKTVKAYTSRGMAEGVIKRDVGKIATDMYREYYRKLDIKSHHLEKEIFQSFVKKVEDEFEIKEVEI